MSTERELIRAMAAVLAGDPDSSMPEAEGV